MQAPCQRPAPVGGASGRTCELAIIEAGFRLVDIVATLAGEPLYTSFGYSVVERFEIAMAGGLSLPVVRMNKGLERRT